MLNRTGSALLGRNAWRSFLALGLALTGVYLLLPRGGLAGGIVYVALGVAMTAAIAVGIAIYRPSPRLPWLLLLAGTALYTTLGNGIWYLLPVGFGKTLPFPSVADAVYLVAYLLELAGLVALVRSRVGSDRSAALDTSLVTIALAFLSWSVLMEPYLRLGGLSPIEKFVSMAYPAVDIVLLAVLARLVFTHGSHRPAFWFLAIYLAGELFSDTAYALTSLRGTFFFGHPLTAGWMISYAFLGAAALHPSMTSLTQRVPDARPSRNLSRTALLIAAALLPLAVLFIQHQRGDDSKVPVVTIICSVMVVLVVARIRHLNANISELDRAQAALAENERRFRSIIETANEAVVGMDTAGRIAEWNREAETTFGWSRDEAIGRVLADTIMPARFRERHTAGLHRFVTTGEARVLGQRLELEGLHRDGHEFPVELSISATGEADSTGFIAFIHDISERRTAEETLRDREAMLQALFAASPDIVTTLGPKGELGEPSPAVKEVLGYELDQYMAMDRLSMVHPDDRERTARVLRTFALGARAFEMRFRMRHADGHWVTLEARGRETLDQQGRRTGGVTVSRDITQRMALEEALLGAKEEADRANQAKSEFLSRMSHELRTPLNAVLGFGQLLEMGELDDERSEYVQQILKGGRHLLALINEVLDIARIESGKLTMSLEPTRVSDAIREPVDLVRTLASERRIKLVVDDGSVAGSFVRADRQRLKQVVLNLLSNAVKYNREAGTVTVRSSEVEGGRLRIEVSDEGPGIHPDSMSRLFAPFERLGAEASEVEGTGLGLALSKGLVEGMAGTLRVESVLGQGSTFIIELPLADVPASVADHETEDAVAGEGPVRSRTILYIEDNLANIQLVEGTLRHRLGVTLLTAMQGSIGLDLARRHLPDVILLDLHLTDMPGQEVLARLRGNSRTCDIPVIVISADATPGRASALEAAGASAYLTKPIDLPIFFRVVEDALAVGWTARAGGA